jgi:hypothetical protein
MFKCCQSLYVQFYIIMGWYIGGKKQITTNNCTQPNKFLNFVLGALIDFEEGAIEAFSFFSQVRISLVAFFILDNAYELGLK